MKSKWFEIDEERKEFESKRDAVNINEAWDKTFEKWELIGAGYKIFGELEGCGLCNVYFYRDCEGCPVSEITGKMSCLYTPYSAWNKRNSFENAAIEYLFLLLVREATK